jgi:dihydrodipicolinate synthase/N-acetylneuraminate lyase
LRDGREAVRLASKAVQLTDSREPIMIGTLAAAYAEAGQFTNAVEMAKAAEFLALITDLLSTPRNDSWKPYYEAIQLKTSGRRNEMWI